MNEKMTIKICPEDFLHRIYPHSKVDNKKRILLYGALNERQAFQVAVMNESLAGSAKVTISTAGPKDLKVRIRRIGYVPVPHLNTPIMEMSDCEGLGHIPGYVPDPLFEESTASIPPQQTHAFWVDVLPTKSAKPGKYQIEVSVTQEGCRQTKKASVNITLADIKLQQRKNFRATHWFYTDALIDWYKTDGYDEKFWKLLPAYLENLASHGQDTVFVPLFTPSLDGVKTPCQLLKVKKLPRGKYAFDFNDVEKFINFAKKAGLKYFEWIHLGTQWGAANAIRIYEGQGRTRKLLWSPETSATSKIYRNFLGQLLPVWHDFLKKHHLLKKSMFHLSDEPRGEEHMKNYRAFRKMLAELAPWMKVMDALSEIDYARAGLTDMPVAIENVVMDFVKEDIPCWVYYCCGPRGKYLNHLIDTPLAKIAMHGLLFYRWKLSGFLHWGYNYWYKRHTTELIDPFTVNDAEAWPCWPHGDTFLVYPGENGPIDSIRWEVFSLSMQDYALLDTLEIDRDDKRLADLRSFEDFPKDPNWRLNLRKKLIGLKFHHEINKLPVTPSKLNVSPSGPLL